MVVFFTFSALKVPAPTVTSSSPTTVASLSNVVAMIIPAPIFEPAGGCIFTDREFARWSPGTMCAAGGTATPSADTTSTCIPEADSSVPSRPPSPVRTPSEVQKASVSPRFPFNSTAS